MQISAYIAWRVDRAVAEQRRLALSNDTDGLRRAQERIELGAQALRSWLQERGGRVIAADPDEGHAQMNAQDADGLENARSAFREAARTPVSIGVGMTLAEAQRALEAAQKRGGDRSLVWSDELGAEAAPKEQAGTPDKAAPGVQSTGQPTAKAELPHSGYVGTDIPSATAPSDNARLAPGRDRELTANQYVAVDDWLEGLAKDEATQEPEPPSAELRVAGQDQQADKLADMLRQPGAGAVPPSLEERLHGYARAQEDQDAQQAQQAEANFRAVRQKVGEALDALRAQMPVLEQMRQQAPEVYKVVVGLAMSVTRMAQAMQPVGAPAPTQQQEQQQEQQHVQKSEVDEYFEPLAKIFGGIGTGPKRVPQAPIRGFRVTPDAKPVGSLEGAGRATLTQHFDDANDQDLHTGHTMQPVDVHRPDLYDYTHMISPELQRQGYQVHVQHAGAPTRAARLFGVRGGTAKAVVKQHGRTIHQLEGQVHPSGELHLGQPAQAQAGAAGGGLAQVALATHAKNKLGAHTMVGPAHAARAASNGGLQFRPQAPAPAPQSAPAAAAPGKAAGPSGVGQLQGLFGGSGAKTGDWAQTLNPMFPAPKSAVGAGKDLTGAYKPKTAAQPQGRPVVPTQSIHMEAEPEAPYKPVNRAGTRPGFAQTMPDPGARFSTGQLHTMYHGGPAPVSSIQTPPARERAPLLPERQARMMPAVKSERAQTLARYLGKEEPAADQPTQDPDPKASTKPPGGGKTKLPRSFKGLPMPHAPHRVDLHLPVGTIMDGSGYQKIRDAEGKEKWHQMRAGQQMSQKPATAAAEFGYATSPLDPTG